MGFGGSWRGWGGGSRLGVGVGGGGRGCVGGWLRLGGWLVEGVSMG